MMIGAKVAHGIINSPAERRWNNGLTLQKAPKNLLYCTSGGIDPHARHLMLQNEQGNYDRVAIYKN